MTAEKKPWYKKIWIWGIVAAVLILGGIGQALGVNDEPDDTQTAEAPEEPTVAPHEPEPDVTDTPDPAEATVSDEERSLALEDTMKTVMGVSESFTELYAQDPTLWGGHISGVRVEGSNAFITLQVAPDQANRDDLGERAAQALSTLLPADAVDDIDWIIVEDATQAVIAQEQPNPLS